MVLFPMANSSRKSIISTFGRLDWFALVPEISLTPQMVDRFIARFGQEQIAVLHSKLSVISL